MHSQHTPLHLLFVCTGNTCRSPMAEGIARKVFGDRADVQSAGVIPGGSGAHPNAIQTLHDLYNLDISDHVPRDVRQLDLNTFDCIIAIGASAQGVLRSCPDLRSKVRSWQVSDPFNQSIEVYEHCARELEARINDLASELLGQAENTNVC